MFRRFFPQPGTASSGGEIDPMHDEAIALKAMAAGDLRHAAYHIGCALRTDPGNTRWLALLDELIARAGSDPLRLAPLGHEPYFATVAVRAYILGTLGEITQAVDLLLQVARVRPDVPYLDWAARWMRHPDLTAMLDPDPVCQHGRWMLRTYPSIVVAEESTRLIIERVLPLFEAVGRLHPEHPDALYLYGALLRKLGRLDEGLPVARAAASRHPNWSTLLGLALAHRARGEVDQALDAFRQALSFGAHRGAICNDAADMLLAAGRLTQAARWYDDALRQTPDDPWAVPSSLFCHHWLAPVEGWDRRLGRYAASHPDNVRARTLSREIQDAARPFVGFLPEMPDACIKLAARVLSEPHPSSRDGTTIEVRLSHLETPSARLAMDLAAATHDPPLRFDVHVDAVHLPDPRVPARPVTHLLWRYDGMTPLPAVAPPAPTIVAELANLAVQPYYLPSWTRLAQAMAGRLGSPALPSLLAAMVYPPPPADGVVAWEWVFRVQLAAALTIADLGGPWPGSERRNALLSLLFGPDDWSAVAAIVALTELARRDRETETEVEAFFIIRLTSEPSETLWYPLVWCLLRLPHIDDDLRGRLVGMLDAARGDERSV